MIVRRKKKKKVKNSNSFKLTGPPPKNVWPESGVWNRRGWGGVWSRDPCHTFFSTKKPISFFDSVINCKYGLLFFSKSQPHCTESQQTYLCKKTFLKYEKLKIAWFASKSHKNTRNSEYFMRIFSWMTTTKKQKTNSRYVLVNVQIYF